jgi:hypothetical protein
VRVHVYGSVTLRDRRPVFFQTTLASLCHRVQSPKDLPRPFINVLAHSHGRAQIIDATETSQSVCEHRAKI